MYKCARIIEQSRTLPPSRQLKTNSFIKYPPLCADSKRLRVGLQNVSVCEVKTPSCFEHVDVLPAHTETFQRYTRKRSHTHVQIKIHIHLHTHKHLQTLSRTHTPYIPHMSQRIHTDVTHTTHTTHHTPHVPHMSHITRRPQYHHPHTTHTKLAMRDEQELKCLFQLSSAGE